MPQNPYAGQKKLSYVAGHIWPTGLQFDIPGLDSDVKSKRGDVLSFIGLRNKILGELEIN